MRFLRRLRAWWTIPAATPDPVESGGSWERYRQDKADDLRGW